MAIFGSMLAYIDPGSGSLILQIIIGGFIASLMFFKSIWYRIISFFKGKKNTDDTE